MAYKNLGYVMAGYQSRLNCACSGKLSGCGLGGSAASGAAPSQLSADDIKIHEELQRLYGVWNGWTNLAGQFKKEIKKAYEAYEGTSPSATDMALGYYGLFLWTRKKANANDYFKNLNARIHETAIAVVEALAAIAIFERVNAAAIGRYDASEFGHGQVAQDVAVLQAGSERAVGMMKAQSETDYKYQQRVSDTYRALGEVGRFGELLQPLVDGINKQIPPNTDWVGMIWKGALILGGVYLGAQALGSGVTKAIVGRG